MSLFRLPQFIRQTADRLRELTRLLQALGDRVERLEAATGQLDVTAAAADNVPWASHHLAHEWALVRIDADNGDGTYTATRSRVTGFGSFETDLDDSAPIRVCPLTSGDLIVGTYQYAHFDALAPNGTPIYHLAPAYKFCFGSEPPGG
jgi:hypothetical protein